METTFTRRNSHGANLKRWREWRGIKQEVLADKIGVSQATLSGYEKKDELEPWLTISVGGVCAIPKEPNRVWDFLSAADNTLYEQKKEQKGKVRFYQGEGKYL